VVDDAVQSAAPQYAEHGSASTSCSDTVRIQVILTTENPFQQTRAQNSIYLQNIRQWSSREVKVPHALQELQQAEPDGRRIRWKASAQERDEKNRRLQFVHHQNAGEPSVAAGLAGQIGPAAGHALHPRIPATVGVSRQRQQRHHHQICQVSHQQDAVSRFLSGLDARGPSSRHRRLQRRVHPLERPHLQL